MKCAPRSGCAIPAAFAALALAASAAAAPPPNDSFVAAQTLSGMRGLTEGTNLEATKEVGEPAHAGNSGGKSIWFRWTAPADGQVRWATVGSAFDTLLGVYQGATVAALTRVAADDDSGGDGESALSFRATAGASYSIAVDGFDGKEGHVVLSWGPAPPNDNFQNPIVVGGTRGSTPATGAGATRETGEPDGGSSIWFQWTAPAAGLVTFAVGAVESRVVAYTGTSLASLTRVSSRDVEGGIQFHAVAGTVYSVAVIDPRRTVTLRWLPPPANDTFAARRALSGIRGRVRGSNLGAGTEGSRFPASSVWYRWRAPRSGPVVFDTNGSDFDTVLGVYSGRSLSRLRAIAVDDDGGTDVDSRVRFRAVRGRVYSLAVGGFIGSTGFFRLNWRPAPEPRPR